MIVFIDEEEKNFKLKKIIEKALQSMALKSGVLTLRVSKQLV